MRRAIRSSNSGPKVSPEATPSAVRRRRTVASAPPGMVSWYHAAALVPVPSGFTAASSPWTSSRWKASFTYWLAFLAPKSSSALVSLSVKSSRGETPATGSQASRSRPRPGWSARSRPSAARARCPFGQYPSPLRPQAQVLRSQSVGSRCRLAGAAPRFAQVTRIRMSSGAGLRVLHEDVEVAVVVEDPGVLELELGLVAATPAGSPPPASRRGTRPAGTCRAP